MPDLQINLGLETVRLVDNLGNELGTLTYNPNDARGIIERADKAKKDLDNIQKEMPEDPDVSDLIKAGKTVEQIIDYIFAAPISETVFKTVSPLSLTGDGKYFFENVMDAFIEEVKVRAEKSREASKKRIGKYTAKYENG